MLFAVAAFGIALFAVTLWCAVAVLRMEGLPRWRRGFPLACLLLSASASALRAVDVPEVAAAAAFPLNLAAVVVALSEIRAARRRRATPARG
ncbi:hypothetical protein PUR59_01255 [Streptomyces sp. SP18ES09]|uniref:hypothetical protein n=1 Tax=Streptomyces sp. SP18ES09 TaxID=3002532 RepID=UPI002E795013|nr:hypothetical protein [Streptomyces sp. SP18ES09]MEE1813669.1 hypothetical protein [Streptomyces sp. SP18ES09]